MERLVTWNEWNLKVSGSHLERLAREGAARRKAPVQDLALDFREGEIVISGRLVTFVPVPFQVSVRRVEHDSGSVRVFLENASAFGFLPLPRILLSLFGDRRVADGLVVHPESLSVSLQLDRFLPSFVELTILGIAIVEGGMRIRCGPGGADPPPDLMK